MALGSTHQMPVLQIVSDQPAERDGADVIAEVTQAGVSNLTHLKTMVN